MILIDNITSFQDGTFWHTHYFNAPDGDYEKILKFKLSRDYPVVERNNKIHGSLYVTVI